MSSIASQPTTLGSLPLLGVVGTSGLQANVPQWQQPGGSSDGYPVGTPVWYVATGDTAPPEGYWVSVLLGAGGTQPAPYVKTGGALTFNQYWAWVQNGSPHWLPYSGSTNPRVQYFPGDLVSYTSTSGPLAGGGVVVGQQPPLYVCLKSDSGITTAPGGTDGYWQRCSPPQSIVNSVEGLTGAIDVVAGVGIDVGTNTNTGVLTIYGTTVNSFRGAVSLTASNGLTITSPTAGTINVAGLPSGTVDLTFPAFGSAQGSPITATANIQGLTATGYVVCSVQQLPNGSGLPLCSNNPGNPSTSFECVATPYALCATGVLTIGFYGSALSKLWNPASGGGIVRVAYQVLSL